MRMSSGFRTIAMSLVSTFILAPGVMGAEDQKTRTIHARGLAFQVPEAWKSVPPATSMRAAELRVDPAEGDKEPAELQVFLFPGGAGTVQANIDRWRTQFVDEGGKAPEKITTEKRKGKNVEATYVEIAGRYVAAVRPGSPEKYDKPNYRLLGAIVETPQGAYFLKLVGPDKTVRAAKPDFEKLIGSLTLEGR